MNEELFILWFYMVGFVIIWFKIIVFFENTLNIDFIFKVGSLNAVGVEPEFLIQDGISLVSSLHVFINFRNWHDEVYVEVVDHVHQESQSNNEASVLEIGQLNVHGSEFHAPTDIWILGRWRLEAERVPICWLQVFEMACQVAVINLIFQEFALIGRNGVSREQSGNMLGKSIINLGFIL